MTFATYLAHPVIHWEPDWLDPVTTFHRRKFRWDNRTGNVRDDHPYEVAPRTLRRMRYVLTERSEIIDALDLIKTTAQGRLKAFWVPDWVDDVFLTAGSLAASSTLAITNIGFTKWYFGEGEGRAHVALFPTAAPGTIVYREVTTSVVVSATAETLTLGAAIGTDLAVGDRVCFLLLCRSDSDEIVLHREHWTLAVLELPIVDVPLASHTAGDPIPLGQAIETDTALPMTGRKLVPALGIATETDTALAMTAQHRIAIGQASETDTALAMTVA